jgi:hypothetical protein
MLLYFLSLYFEMMCFFYTKPCNNGLCTSIDVEGGICIHYLKNVQDQEINCSTFATTLELLLLPFVFEVLDQNHRGQLHFSHCFCFACLCKG